VRAAVESALGVRSQNLSFGLQEFERGSQRGGDAEAFAGVAEVADQGWWEIAAELVGGAGVVAERIQDLFAEG
jgi:hypothetical protein